MGERIEATRTVYYCEKKVRTEDDFGGYDYESTYCDDHHTTLGIARAHCKSLGYTHTVEHTMVGYDDGEYFTVEDDDFKVRSIELSYQEAK
jgi:hypothetical protein